jgi:hypothetical protein
MAVLGTGDESRRRRMAAGSLDLAENGRSCTVLSAGCTERSQVLRETHLKARVGEAGAGERCTAEAHGHGAPTKNRACGKAEKRGRRSRQGSSPQHGASGALAQRCGAVERRRVGQPKRGDNGGGS